MIIVKRVLIVVDIIVCVVIIRYPGYWPGAWTDKSAAYHQWIYIDPVETPDGTKAVLADLSGDHYHEDAYIPAYRGDRLIFVNRTATTVTVTFTHSDIFGASNKVFTIEPGKRKVRKVIGPPSPSYTFTVTGVGFIGTPTVKVGDDP